MLISLAAVTAAAAAACSKPTPSPPAVTPSGPVTVTGTEHLTWDQFASGSGELSTIGFEIYVDSTRSTLMGVVCAATATPGTFECKAPLPPMDAGRHMIQLTSFYEDRPADESSKAGPLVLIVVGPASTAGPQAAPVAPASSRRRKTAADDAGEWPPSAVQLADGLDQPADLAFTPDTRLWIAERGGRVRVVHDGAMAAEPALKLPTPGAGAGAIVALAVDPQFARTRFIFAIYTARSRSGGLSFTIARFREAANTLADRIVILDDVPASLETRAVLRFGPDGKLYAAFDDGGDGRLVEDLASFNGKILRLNPDGTTPDDAARKSPLLMSGIASPRGLAWHGRSGRLWAADRESVGPIRWSAPPTSLAILRDDLFVGSDVGLVRGRIDERHPSRLTGLAEVLRNVSVRAVAAGPDGALYFLTAHALGRLRD